MSNKILGIVPPMVTPFDEYEALDEAALRADVEYLISEAKVHGLAVGGSTGEGHTLSTDELRRAVGTAVDAAAGRVPIVAGVIVDSTQQAIERSRALADLDVAALQITPVHYLFRPTDDALLRHFATITEAVDLPIIIYNVVPWVYLSPQLLTRIMDEVPGVIGVKQSAGDLKTVADLMLLCGERHLIMSAVDALMYPSFALGAHGAIAAILTAVPHLCVQLWDAVQAGDHAQALDLHQRLLPIWNAIMGDNLPANVKYAMTLQGRAGGIPRAPMPASSAAQQAAIRAAMPLAGVSDLA
ncbi:MAG: dihydrodipicolinate synthase family protein [Ardenticatenaceae bacterium]|nr:dihydrodipicolinate synthase family protein [Ardenticatenaceae bacterium]